MATAGLVATNLDIGMLAGKCSDENVDIKTLPIRTGQEVADELGRRMLLHYLVPAKQGTFRNGGFGEFWVSPTPYTPAEASRYLALPEPDEFRKRVLYLRPEIIEEIQGPKKVELGGGVEYFLPKGFPKGAIVLGWDMRIQ